MRISELNFPKAMNIDLLSEILPEKNLLELILNNCSKDRKARRIMLPSKSCLKKLVFYYYGKKVADGKMTWPQAMKKLREGFETLKEMGLERETVKSLYAQREREIQREKRDKHLLF